MLKENIQMKRENEILKERKIKVVPLPGASAKQISGGVAPKNVCVVFLGRRAAAQDPMESQRTARFARHSYS